MFLSLLSLILPLATFFIQHLQPLTIDDPFGFSTGLFPSSFSTGSIFVVAMTPGLRVTLHLLTLFPMNK